MVRGSMIVTIGKCISLALSDIGSLQGPSRQTSGVLRLTESGATDLASVQPLPVQIRPAQAPPGRQASGGLGQIAKVSEKPSKAASQPPLPSTGLQMQAQNLKPAKLSQPPLPTKALQSQAHTLKPGGPARQTPPQQLPAGSQVAPKPQSSIPPLPGKALQQQAQSLKPGKPSQPPLPSKAQQSQAQNLKPAPPSQPPLPAPALQAQAQSLKSSASANPGTKPPAPPSLATSTPFTPQPNAGTLSLERANILISLSP